MKPLAQQLAPRKHGIDIRADGVDGDGGDHWSSALYGPLPTLNEPGKINS